MLLLDNFTIIDLHVAPAGGSNLWSFTLDVDTLMGIPSVWSAKRKFFSTEHTDLQQNTLHVQIQPRIPTWSSPHQGTVQMCVFTSSPTNIFFMYRVSILSHLSVPKFTFYFSILNTVILLWTLYYTKHRNWFHKSLVMFEIFTKLPLKILEVWFLYRQAVRNSLKKKLGISLFWQYFEPLTGSSFRSLLKSIACCFLYVNFLFPSLAIPPYSSRIWWSTRVLHLGSYTCSCWPSCTHFL